MPQFGRRAAESARAGTVGVLGVEHICGREIPAQIGPRSRDLAREHAHSEARRIAVHIGRAHVVDHRHDQRRQPQLRAYDLEAGVAVEERLERTRRVAPEVPRQLVLRPGVVCREEQQPAFGEHRVDLERGLPRHRQVLERRDGVDRLERPLDVLRERVHVADDVDVGAGVDVEADILAHALQPRIDARAARPELEHPVVAERVGGRDEIGEHGVVGVIGPPAPQWQSGCTDQLDERPPPESLEGRLHAPDHGRRRTRVIWGQAPITRGTRPGAGSGIRFR